MTERLEILPVRVETSYADILQGILGGNYTEGGFAVVQTLLQGNLAVVVAPIINFSL